MHVYLCIVVLFILSFVLCRPFFVLLSHRFPSAFLFDFPLRAAVPSAATLNARRTFSVKLPRVAKRLECLPWLSAGIAIYHN